MKDPNKALRQIAETIGDDGVEALAASDEGAVLMPLLCTAKVQEYRDNGWVFEYCDDTKFVAACHLNGGKQSICEMKNRFDNAAFGHAIAKYLNGIGT